jgi:hypothetical protein
VRKLVSQLGAVLLAGLSTAGILAIASRDAAAQTVLVCGQIVVGEIAVSDERDLFTFTADSGDVVSITLVTTGSLDAGFGAVADLSVTSSGALVRFLSGGATQVSLPDTGSYTLRVRDFFGTRRGSYAVLLDCRGLQIPVRSVTAGVNG